MFIKRELHCAVCSACTRVEDQEELTEFVMEHMHPEPNEDGDVDVHTPQGVDEVQCTTCLEWYDVDMHNIDWAYSEDTDEAVCATCSVREKDQWQTS